MNSRNKFAIIRDLEAHTKENKLLKQDKHIHSVSNSKQLILSNTVSLVSLAVIAGGIATSIFMNCVNRSLWLDEAMLAYSFSKRSFLQLWNGPLEWLQSAPLGWLYLEKTLTILFGNTEYVLRIGSVLGYTFTIVALFFLLKQLSVAPAFCLLACAFYANMPFILKYSNVFKPYIFDGFIVLLAALLFQLYNQDKLRTVTLAILWAVLIWFSMPVCFFEGGMLLAAGLLCMERKDLPGLKLVAFVGIAIMISFAADYCFWLGNNSIVQGMQVYWKGYNFPLIPTSLDDLTAMRDMIKELIIHFGTQSNTVLLTLVIFLPFAVREKNSTVIGCYLGIILALFASWIRMFPIYDRLWCFFYPLTIFLSFYGLYRLSQTDKKLSCLLLSLLAGVALYQQIRIGGVVVTCIITFVALALLPLGSGLRVNTTLALSFALLLVFSVHGIRQYWNNADAVFWPGEELNPEIEYLEANLKKDEHVYVYIHSVPGFQYKNGYDKSSIAGFDNNITFGEDIFLSEAEPENPNAWMNTREGYAFADNYCEEEIAKVVNKNNVYIVYSHSSGERLEKLIDAIHENGYLQLVSYEHQTPLWYFCRNIDDSKIHVSYKTGNMEVNGSKKAVTFLLQNDGPAYINHQFEDVCLVNTSSGEKYELPKNLAPGSSIELTVSYEGNPPVFRLENEYGLVCADSDYIPE